MDNLFQSFSPILSRCSVSKKFAKLQELLPPSPANSYPVLQLASLWLSQRYTESPLVKTRISDPTSVFAYKKVANKTGPVATTLPEKFCQSSVQLSPFLTYLVIMLTFAHFLYTIQLAVCHSYQTLSLLFCLILIFYNFSPLQCVLPVVSLFSSFFPLHVLSGTYPVCDSSMEFVHIDLCINSMACVVPWLGQGFHKWVHSLCGLFHKSLLGFCGFKNPVNMGQLMVSGSTKIDGRSPLID